MTLILSDIAKQLSRIISLAPGRHRCHFKTANFNLILLIGIFTSSKDNAMRWMPRDLTDDESTLVQVMAWCCQATRHYLNQCWPRSLPPYGFTRPQWVKFKNTFCFCEIALRWLSYNTVDDKSTLVQVMPWCHLETNHYLNQWWPKIMSPNGVIWLQYYARKIYDRKYWQSSTVQQLSVVHDGIVTFTYLYEKIA